MRKADDRMQIFNFSKTMKSCHPNVLNTITLQRTPTSHVARVTFVHVLHLLAQTCDFMTIEHGQITFTLLLHGNKGDFNQGKTQKTREMKS